VHSAIFSMSDSRAKTLILVCLGFLLFGATSIHAYVPSLKTTRLSLGHRVTDVNHHLHGLTQSLDGRRTYLKAEVEEASGWLELEKGENSPPRLLYGAIWLMLTAYAFNFAPGAGAEAAAVDLQLAKKMITTPFDGQGSAIFAAVFNSLGVLPAIYGALLLPGGKRQKLPALAFVSAMFAGGYFAIGPYLALRNRRTEGITQAKTTRGRGSVAFESRLTGLLLTTFSLWLAYYALFSGGDASAAIKQYTELFWTQRLVHVSTIDAVILSLFVAEPMSEDMQRRGFDGPPAAAFAALPIIGPSLYLLMRPRLAAAAGEEEE
jgi:hypothetical protein